jgi:hypothetical protein
VIGTAVDRAFAGIIGGIGTLLAKNPQIKADYDALLSTAQRRRAR